MSVPTLSSEGVYAQRRKQLLTLTKDLRAVGAHIHLDLPRIVVIGNQSAGKSSLIEAISGIKVPRDVGTCTRCPMECRLLSSKEEWSCQVSIRWEFDTDSRRKNHVEEVPFGGLLTDKSDVELMLRRAQTAVLNAGKQPLSHYVNMKADDLTALSRVLPSIPFSQNVVCVDISGPELTDLSFVDLPGIISNADASVVKFVERMVQSYISGTCLIVVALPMSDDIENQTALRLAREADRDGSRTIGVMTKPDTLTPGSIKAKDLWLEILEGRSQNHFLRHGYYCTRQPDDGERTAGITPSEAREAETRFFQNTAPWDTSADKQRFGTKNLVKYLSGMLTQIINKVLPKLQREVENKLTACYTELRKLPKEVTSEPAAFVFGLLSSFCTDIRSRVSGIPGAEILVQQSRREFEALKHAIRGTAPRFIPLPSARDAPFSSTVDVLSDLDEDNETIINGLPPGTSTNEIYLKDMRVHIRRSMTRELPFNVPYPAKTLLIQRFQETWERECFACFEKIQRLFNRTLSQLMRDRFGRFRHLESQIEAAVMSLLQVRRTAASEQIEILLKFETTPFTQNTHYLSDATDKVLSRYKDIRGGRTSVRCLPEAEATAEEPLVYHADGKHEEKVIFAEDEPPSREDHPVPIEQTAEEIYWHESPPRELPPKRKGKKSKGKSPWSLRPVEHYDEAEVEFTPAVPSPAFGGFGGLDTSDSPTASTAVNASAPTYANARYAPSSPVVPPFALPAISGTPHGRLEAEAFAALAKLGYVGLTADDLGKLNPPDEYEEELSVMAEVRAYFQVSYKRIIDYIPLAIDHTFLFAFAEALQLHLIEALALGTPDAAARCATYLSEELDIVSRRQELTGKKTSLEKAKMELMSASLAGVEVSAPS